MSVLTGSKIHELISKGDLVIDPYDPKQLGPNSYNLTLASVLKVYDELLLDCKKDNKSVMLEIEDDGFVLIPGQLYLGRTVEFTETKNHIPMIEGRSSFARLGMSIHVTGGFGDIGFQGNWTLEITVVRPLLIYPNMKVCQIYYHEPVGTIDQRYSGKYQGDVGIGTSRIHSELCD